QMDLPPFLKNAGPPAPPVERRRFRRPRWSIRGMMVAMAIVACLLGGVQCWRLHQIACVYRERAALYAWHVAYWSGKAQAVQRAGEKLQAEEDEWRRKTGAPLPRPDANFVINALTNARAFARTAEFYLDLQRKYEQAAAHPWAEVDDDPPRTGAR
ncbi:MAG: hypothetical protein ACP5XB_22970, partial [Isosphaeraceae bacterium]